MAKVPRPEDIAIGERLRGMLGKVDLTEASQVAGTSIYTLRRWIAGETAPNPTGLARLATYAGADLHHLLTGESLPSKAVGGPRLELVKVIDARVSAGPGASVLDERASYYLGFPGDMLRALTRNLSSLAILTVQGESMEPDLHAGDLVMVDPTRNRPQDGMYVLREEAELLVKRVRRVSPSEIVLISANPAYEPRTVHLDKEDFSIIGRAIWLGRALS